MNHFANETILFAHKLCRTESVHIACIYDRIIWSLNFAKKKSNLKLNGELLYCHKMMYVSFR